MTTTPARSRPFAGSLLKERIPLLKPYQVTQALMDATGHATKFLHCLPALHDTSTALGQRLHEQYGMSGAEVADEVFQSPRSLVFDQAENRLHTIEAVLVAALATDPLTTQTA